VIRKNGFLNAQHVIGRMRDQVGGQPPGPYRDHPGKLESVAAPFNLILGWGRPSFRQTAILFV